MKIKAWSFGLAGGITFCSAYIAFALALKFFPSQTLKLIGTIHMMPRLDYIKSFITVTPRAILIGMACSAITVFLICWIMASIYNIFQRE